MQPRVVLWTGVFGTRRAADYRRPIGRPLSRLSDAIGVVTCSCTIGHYRSYRSPLSELSELTIGAIGAHYRMLRDHAKVTKGEVEHNHIQMYVAATKEFLNHWTASTSLTFGRRRRCHSDGVDVDKRA